MTKLILLATTNKYDRTDGRICNWIKSRGAKHQALDLNTSITNSSLIGQGIFFSRGFTLHTLKNMNVGLALNVGSVANGSKALALWLAPM